jgi:hypothetical protein
MFVAQYERIWKQRKLEKVKRIYCMKGNYSNEIGYLKEPLLWWPRLDWEN